MSTPLPVAEALACVLSEVSPLPGEQVDLDDAPGRVLSRDIVSELDVPPFDNSAMDGYAVRLADLCGASEFRPVVLGVQQTIVAAPGSPAPLAPGRAAKIMTGAQLPAGAEAVVPVELTTQPEPASVAFRTVPRLGANCRPAGDDLAAGAVVLRAGTTVGHAEVALLAAVGCARVEVARRPRAVVISTGDELVPVTDTPGPGQIRDSSIHALAAQLRGAGAEVARVAHAIDSEAALDDLLGHLPPAELVVCCGGVSMGDKDFVRPVFERRGQPVFWRVAIKPGKPLLFGRLDEALFFGLPGNPVSSMVTCDLFVKPAIDAMLGRIDGGRLVLSGRMGHALGSDPERDEYVRVVVRSVDGQVVVTATGSQSSGRMMSMVGADGYAVIPAGVGAVAAGDEVRLELMAARIGRG